MNMDYNEFKALCELKFGSVTGFMRWIGYSPESAKNWREYGIPKVVQLYLSETQYEAEDFIIPTFVRGK